ncbi:LOW QUALITY PROTEIN: metastasis-suppressor KiSS-1 [Oncorhynchus masou masou]|uniref:LOW QUALITY PROTEIN: metastasis-suppressor KiSS-1 n=1 Tax=Oncorhynchus masou masou TaxID=90313 RepID=UPI003183F71B
MRQFTVVLMLIASLTETFPTSSLRYSHYTQGESPDNAMLKVLRDLSTASTEGPPLTNPALLPNDVDNPLLEAELPRRVCWWWYPAKPHPQNRIRQNRAWRSSYNHNSFGLRYGK